MDDPIAVLLKVVSIIAAGAFGMLGLVTEFKSPATRKLTKWGAVSLVGILISTMLGVTVQIRETSQLWKTTLERQKKQAVDTALSLKIASQTNEAVKNLRRLLTPLDEPKYSLTLSAPCTTPELNAMCASVRNSGRPLILGRWTWGDARSRKLWKAHWPKNSQYEAAVDIDFFCNGTNWESAPTWDEVKSKSDMSFILGQTYENNVVVEVDPWRDQVRVMLRGIQPQYSSNSGAVRSLEDLSNCDVVLLPLLELPFTPVSLSVQTGDGRELSVTPTGFSALKTSRFRRLEDGTDLREGIRYLYLARHLP